MGKLHPDQEAAMNARIKEDEALHEQLHKQMLSDSEIHDKAVAAAAEGPAEEGSEERLELGKTAPAKKVK